MLLTGSRFLDARSFENNVFSIYIKSVKWAQEDVETLYILLNNNYLYIY